MVIAQTTNNFEKQGHVMKLLIVDDEPAILEALESKMRRENYSTFAAASAEDALRIFRKVKPDLIILDIMLPQRSGLDFCRIVRHESDIPIIFLSAKADEKSRIEGLEMGGDDYLTKPFNMSELALRVKAILRRTVIEDPSEIVERGNLIINPVSHIASIDGQAMDVSPREFSLLYFLTKHAGQVFSREVLIDRVWGQDSYVTVRTVDVHIRWLRTRIEPDPNNPVRIQTVRGIGYKFVN